MSVTTAIGVIGTGRVGASVALSTLHSGIARELLLYDQKEAVAEGEANHHGIGGQHVLG